MFESREHLSVATTFPFPPFREELCHSPLPLLPGTSQGASKRRMGSRLYPGIIYYKWRHSQGRHYQTLAPSRIPTAPITVSLHPPRPLSIHSARGLSIRTAELLCRLIDSLSERCEVRYSTWYRFNFMPIISVQREANGAEGGRRMNIRDTSHCSFLFQDSFGQNVGRNDD